MSGNLNLKEFEEKVDKHGLPLDMKDQFEKSPKACDSLLAKVEASSPANQLQNKEKNAIIAYLLTRKEHQLSIAARRSWEELLSTTCEE